jgi:hypothetical protein
MQYGMLLNQAPTPNSLKKYFIPVSGQRFNSEANNFNYCGSGKAAISLILSYLNFIGVLENKMSPILVSKWMGVEVYGSITKHSFPTFDMCSKAKVIIVYHQYGFPQDMDRILDFAQSRKMIVIEDCAHSINSKYKGKKLGTIGDYSIYSFSKFVYCNVLGGVSSKNDDFSYFFNKRLNKSSKFLSFTVNLIKLLSSYNINRGGGRVISLDLTRALTLMAYSQYTNSLIAPKGNINMFENQYNREISSRVTNYEYMKEKLSEYGVFEYLNDDVTPYAIPLKIPSMSLHGVVNKLNMLGVETGVYNFDINRFMPEPNFIKTALVPCHSNLSRGIVDKMLDIIVSEIRS